MIYGIRTFAIGISLYTDIYFRVLFQQTSDLGNFSTL